MHRFLAATCLAIAAGAGPALASEWTPDDAAIAKLEAQIVIPDAPKHDPVTLASYSRWYNGVKVDGMFAIYGQLAVPRVSGEQPAIHIVRKSDVPAFTAAGCEHVSLMYDVKYDKVVWIQCSGSQ